MNCIDPPALPALELASYLAGEANTTITNHVAACSFCRANLVALAEEERALTGLLYRSTCPTPEELRDYQRGLLNRADGSNVALHLAHCPHCTHELFVLQEFMAEQSSTANSLQQLVLRVATLLNPVLPSTGAMAPLGQRGAVDAPQLYQAGELQIGLEILADSSTGQRRLQGVITGGELDNLLVHLWRDGQLIATTTVDPLLGDFHFANLSLPTGAAARYELIVSAPQVKVRVPALQFDR